MSVENGFKTVTFYIDKGGKKCVLLPNLISPN